MYMPLNSLLLHIFRTEIGIKTKQIILKMAQPASAAVKLK